MSATTRRYVQEKEILESAKGFTEREKIAIELRKDFFKKYILKFDTRLYPTVQERDWAYIAKREYNYSVVLYAALKSLFYGGIAFSSRMFVAKRVIWWPLPVITLLSFNFVKDTNFEIVNKRLFDMCNVGEQFTLGQNRNKVLRECNRILDREDF